MSFNKLCEKIVSSHHEQRRMQTLHSDQFWDLQSFFRFT